MTTTSQTGVGLLLGQIARVALAIRSTHVCQLPRAITFPTARSFIRPTAANKAAFADLMTRLTIGGTLNQLLINGHTDSAGGSGATGRTQNQELSDRRTQAVNAVLRNDPSVWETLFNPNSEGWGNPELTEMATEVGETDVSRFRGAGNAANRLGPTGLYSRYFARLLAGARVPPITRTTPPLLGCGQQHLLRGNRASPSRDPAQPAIEGEFEANRRVEFFFFDSTPSTIACPEYPTWTGTCSLTPPAPPTVTVTIAAIDSVRRGNTIDVLVTINPSPLPFGTQVTLTLSTTSGTGEAKFASNDSSTLNITATGQVRIQGVTPSSGVDNIRISASVSGQTAVLAQEDFTVVEAIAIFLQFEVCHATTFVFEPMPPGIEVDLTHDVGDGRVIRTERTTAGGRVFFNLPDLSASGVPNPDIFFLVRTDGSTTHAGHTLPARWSTRGWLAADNRTPGLQPGFTGPQLGTPTAPIVFRVGLDLHGLLQYRVDGGPRVARPGARPQIDPAPKGILIALMKDVIGLDEIVTAFRTDEDGRFDAVIFNVLPGSNLYIKVIFDILDATINLRRARFSTVPFVPPLIDVLTPPGPTMEWNSSDADADQNEFRNQRRTSIGSARAQERFTCTLADRNVALHILKSLRELAVFFFHLTQGAWQGVEVAVTPSAPVRAFSWPVGRLQLKFPDDRWNRSTVIHEMSHQLMWAEVDFTGLGIVYQGFFGDLHLNHRSYLMATTLQALVEGWAEFVEAVFKELAPTPPYPRAVSGPEDSSGNPVLGGLGPPPLNRGELIEGDVANGLWGIFEDHVAQLPAPLSAHIPESANGDVTTTSSWIQTRAIQLRFLSMIWNPLKDLRPPPPNPDSTALFARIRARNANWHVLQPELQRFNMAMTVPTVTATDPTGGPPSGNITVTITGTEFTGSTTSATPPTSVTFNGVAATNVDVINSTTLRCTIPPGALGPADVVVTTRAGSSTAFRGFTYALVPRIISVTLTGAPAGTAPRGPTSGDTPITITGENFQPGARVFFGGLPEAGGEEATDVQVFTAFEITARTPVFPVTRHRPGGTVVIVRNPDRQHGSLDPGFDYLLAPTPHISLLDPPNGLAAGNQVVEIVGTNLDPGARVKIDGRNADVVSQSSRGLSVLTPPRPGTTGSVVVDVELRNPDEQVATGGFTYTP